MPEDKAKVRIGRLTSVGMVGIEIGRIYRKARHGEIASADAMRFVQMLLGLKSCLETSEIEKQIAEIKASLSLTNVVPFKARGA